MMESNLDKVVAEAGLNLADEIISRDKTKAKELEKIINKAIGILIEEGLLAYAIWLESENEEDIIKSSYNLLKDKVGIINEDYKGKESLRIAILNEFSSSIQKTLLAKQILERMLVYARYRAKALQKESDQP
jgi:hypothetical protein